MATTLQETVEPRGALVAEDVMTARLATVDETATVGEALSVMRQWGVRHLPVTEHGCLVGLVDERSVEEAARAGSEVDLSGDARVDEVMSRYVPQVGPQTPVARVARLLHASRSEAVAVVDEQEHLLGLITLVDIVAAAAD